MSGTTDALRSFLDAAPACALVEIIDAKGSTPRDKGTWMLVSKELIFGTIGGGQLEYMAIDQAREMLVGRGTSLLSIPLGPEIGQCCGGRVEVGIKMVDEALKDELLAAVASDDRRLPDIYVFGGGHVGHALASAFALLPVRTIVVETRAEALEGMPGNVETRLTPVPEAAVRQARAGSAFVVLTHDHALDFLIVSEALSRNDAAYVGMIGSRTKKAVFKSWYLKKTAGTEQAFARLVSPIGGDAVRDKRPAVIAALAAAEIIAALSTVAVSASAVP